MEHDVELGERAKQREELYKCGDWVDKQAVEPVYGYADGLDLEVSE